MDLTVRYVHLAGFYLLLALTLAGVWGLGIMLLVADRLAAAWQFMPSFRRRGPR